VSLSVAMKEQDPMMLQRKNVLSLFLAGVLLVGASACREKGPAEKAGEKVDDAMSKAGDKLQDAGDKMKDAVHK
jgi:hypothetical protein